MNSKIEKKPCPNCEALKEFELVSYKDILEMKGQIISFDAESYQCLDCNEKMDTFETLDLNLKSARKVYKEIKSKTHDEKALALYESIESSLNSCLSFQLEYYLTLKSWADSVYKEHPGNSGDSIFIEGMALILSRCQVNVFLSNELDQGKYEWVVAEKTSGYWFNTFRSNLDAIAFCRVLKLKANG